MAWVLFIMLLPPFRLKDESIEPVSRKRSIEHKKAFGERVVVFLKDFFLDISIMSILYIVFFNCLSVRNIYNLIEWYKNLFLVVLIPFFLGRVADKSNKQISFWAVVIFILSLVGSVLCYSIAITEEIIINFKLYFLVYIVLFVFSFFKTILDIFKQKDKIGFFELPSKGIRKDLFYRTPRLNINVSDGDLIKYCEKYFSEFLYNIRRIKRDITIEYVYMLGNYKMKICKKEFYTTVFFAFFSLIYAFCFPASFYKRIALLSLVFLFFLFIFLLFLIDKNSLYKLGIRLFYDDWGYFITLGEKKTKFVGEIQLFELSKYHKFIHSFLDIVALCRAVAIGDERNGSKTICTIAQNLSELYTDYMPYRDSWIGLLPVWAAALYEYKVTHQITKFVKETLAIQKEEDFHNINLFLQSFWTDIERIGLDKGTGEYVKQFLEEINNNNN